MNSRLVAAGLNPRARRLVGAQTDSAVVLIVGALMAIGVVMVYSASVTIRGSEFDWRHWWNTPLRQCVFAVVGFLTMLVAAHVSYRLLAWERRGDGWWCAGLYLLAVLLLVAMLVPGIGTRTLGAQRAIALPSGFLQLSFQPAELAKVLLIVWLAALLSRPGVDMRSLAGGFLPAVLSAGLLIGLTGIEDFGTAALMGIITLGMLVLAGARWSHVLGTATLGAIAGAGLIFMKRYRMQRLITFFSEAPDPRGDGYQVTQSLIAIGSGGWWGRGLGAGVQKYGYLPQDNNDFVFAILCEELGIVGGLIVLALFLLLVWRGFLIARRAQDRFGQLLALGVTLMLGLQAAFNIAVVTDSIPTKGISLPFVSAGGSGVVFLGLAAGLLASVGRAAMRPADPRPIQSRAPAF